MSASPRVAVVGAVFALVAMAGCASERRTSSTTTTVRLGDGVMFDENDAATATTGEPAAATTSTVPSAAVQPQALTSQRAAGATGSVRGHRTVADRDGFRLHLSVGDDGRLEFGAEEVVRLTLRVENISRETREYDTNDLRSFAIVRAGTSDPVWDNSRCRKGQSAPDRVTTGVLELPPGESVSYADAYPADISSTDALPREDCRIPSGSYDVVGIFNWCPPGSAPNGTCYPDRLAHVYSLPVRIRIT